MTQAMRNEKRERRMSEAKWARDMAEMARREEEEIVRREVDWRLNPIPGEEHGGGGEGEEYFSAASDNEAAPERDGT